MSMSMTLMDSQSFPPVVANTSLTAERLAIAVAFGINGRGGLLQPSGRSIPGLRSEPAVQARK